MIEWELGCDFGVHITILSKFIYSMNYFFDQGNVHFTHDKQSGDMETRRKCKNHINTKTVVATTTKKRDRKKIRFLVTLLGVSSNSGRHPWEDQFFMQGEQSSDKKMSHLPE